MVKKVLYFLQFGGKIYFANCQEPEPHVFGPLEPKPLEKKYQEPEPLGKQSGAGAANKLDGSSALPNTNILKYHHILIIRRRKRDI